MKSGATLFVIVSLAAIAVAATVVYVSTWSDAFIADDWVHLLHSKNLTFSTFARNCSFVREDRYYRPVAIGYYYLNYAVWGLEPTGHHVVKGMFFAATAGLLFVFVLRATGLKIAALAAGLVFALHPLNAECGVWIATHGNVLCAFFYLLALILFVEVRKRERFSFPLYAGFLVSMLFCFGSYELGYTLPLALILTDLLLRPHASSLKPRAFLRAHAPYLVLAAAFLVPRFVFMGVHPAGNPIGEVRTVAVAATAFMPVSEMEFNEQYGVRLLPALAGLAFFAAVLFFGRGLRRAAIFGALLTIVGIVPVMRWLNPVIAFGNTRFLIISLAGFGVLVGAYVSLLWQWRAGRVAGAVFLAALVGVYAWLDVGWKEKWSLAAAQSEAVIETAAEACRGETSPFRLVFLTYPEVHYVFNTPAPLVILALATKDVIRVEQRFLYDSPYNRVFDDINLQTPEARKELIRWAPVCYGSLDAYNSGTFDPSDKVYEIARQDLDRTFFFYWDDEERRLVDCTGPMRERLAKERDKALFAWSVAERIPAERISFPSFEGRQSPEDGAVYLSPVRGGAVPPLIRIILDDTACRDFDVVEIDISAASKSWRGGYFTVSVCWLMEGEKESAEALQRGVKFVGTYNEFHENRHVYWIPLAQKFAANDGRRVVRLYIVLPFVAKEYALRGIRLRRLDE